MSGDDDAVARYITGMRELRGLVDYGALAERLAPVVAALVGAAAPAAGSRVLDLDAGTGTVALLAAGRGAHVTAGIADVLDWGRTVVRDRLTAAGLTPVRTQRRTVPWRFDSPPAMTEFLLAHSPAHQASARALAAQAGEMFEAVERLANPDGGPVRIAAEYLLVIAHAD